MSPTIGHIALAGADAGKGLDAGGKVMRLAEFLPITLQRLGLAGGNDRIEGYGAELFDERAKEVCRQFGMAIRELAVAAGCEVPELTRPAPARGGNGDRFHQPLLRHLRQLLAGGFA